MRKFAGYLVFTKRPSDETQKRFQRVCKAYLRNLEPLADYAGVDSKSLLVTFWLLRSKLIPRLRSGLPNCKQLIRIYDYATATVIASSLGKLNTKGPILAAWEKPFGADPSRPDVLVLDLSNFPDKSRELDRAFGIWKDRISRNPSVWKDGFSIVLARENFRNLIQKYGQQIIDVITAKLS